MSILVLGSGDTMNLYDAVGMTRCLDSDAFYSAIPDASFGRVRFSPNNNYMAVSVLYGVNFVYDVSNGWTKITNEAFGSETHDACAFSPDGSLLVFTDYTGSDHSFRIFTTSDWQQVTWPNASITERAYACEFSPNGQYLAVGFSNSGNTLKVFNTSDWTEVTLGSTPNGWPATWVSFSPDGSKLAVAYNGNSRVAIYDTATWAQITTGIAPSANPKVCKFSKTGAYFIVTQYTSAPYVRAYNTSDWSAISIDSSDASYIEDVDFTADDGLMFYTSSSGGSDRICAYDTTTTPWALGTPIDSSLWPTKSCKTLTLSAATTVVKSVGTTAANPVADNTAAPISTTVRLYSRGTGKLLATTTSDAAGAYSFSPLAIQSEVDVVFLDPASGALFNDEIIRVLPG